MALSIELMKNTSNLLVKFEKFLEQEKVLLIQQVLCGLSRYANKQYLVRIHGLEVTIKNFIKEASVENYQLIKGVKRNIFVEELANINYFTNREEDINILATYFGAFNEGYISIDIFRGTKMINIENFQLDDFEQNTTQDHILEILIEPDGDVLRINNYKEKYDLLKIILAISDMFLNC